MKYKKWTLAEKLEILSSGDAIGVVESCRKYGVSTGTFYNWNVSCFGSSKSLNLLILGCFSMFHKVFFR